MEKDQQERLLAAMHGLKDRLGDSLPDAPPKSNREFVLRANGVLSAYLEWLDACAAAGLSEYAEAEVARLRAFLQESMHRDHANITKGERRALVAAALYRLRYRLPNAGPSDSPMQAAMMATDLFIDTADEVGADATEAAWSAAFLRRYDGIVEGERNSSDHERVKRSITRFKGRLESQPMVSFDPDKMQFRLVKYDEAAHGLNREPGRPKKSAK